MMRHVQWNISAGAILLAALLYFVDGDGVMSALLPAALVHELGHIAALRLCACRLTRVSISVTGAQLDYAPSLEGLRAALCCLAGPLAGAVYAVTACTVGGAFWRMSGAISFALSVFNCLPIMPLDGGRILFSLLPAAQARTISRIAALLFFAGGIAIALRFRSVSMAAMGIWLAVHNLRGDASK